MDLTVIVSFLYSLGLDRLTVGLLLSLGPFCALLLVGVALVWLKERHRAHRPPPPRGATRHKLGS